MRQNTCPECTIPSTPSHFQQWLESFFSHWSRWALAIIPLPRPRGQRATQFTQWCWKIFMQVLVATGLSQRIDDPSRFTVHRTRSLWESAERLGIQMHGFQTFGSLSNLFIARYKNREIFFEGLPRPLDALRATDWMDDKERTRTMLAAQQLPIARGGCVRTLGDAIVLFRSLRPPVVVKPVSSSGSRHTTVHIQTEGAFIRAFLLAKQTSWLVVVEEEIGGTVHRALTIEGRCVAVCRREMPLVVGDGVHSIAQLVQQENKHPLRQGPIYGHLPSKGDAIAESELARQGTSWEIIPPQGASVLLGDKEHRGRGGAVIEVTPDVHPDNRALFERIASVVNDPLIGIDVILEDIAAPWRQQSCAIIELNSIPFIDLHTHPLYGDPVPVADEIWKLVFPTIRD